MAAKNRIIHAFERFINIMLAHVNVEIPLHMLPKPHASGLVLLAVLMEGAAVAGRILWRERFQIVIKRVFIIIHANSLRQAGSEINRGVQKKYQNSLIAY